MSKYAFGTSCYIFVIIKVELASRDAAAAATATKWGRCCPAASRIVSDDVFTISRAQKQNCKEKDVMVRNGARGVICPPGNHLRLASRQLQRRSFFNKPATCTTNDFKLKSIESIAALLTFLPLFPTSCICIWHRNHGLQCYHDYGGPCTSGFLSL